jgi:hypothetical protein
MPEHFDGQVDYDPVLGLQLPSQLQWQELSESSGDQRLQAVFHRRLAEYGDSIGLSL